MSLQTVICDASVVLKWIYPEEDQADEAEHLLELCKQGKVTLAAIDLTTYEVLNVLLRRYKMPASQAAKQLKAIRVILADIYTPTEEEFELAAKISEEKGLSLYDAAYAAAAKKRSATLVTADKEILASGLGQAGIT